jgi:predicted nucleic acid-binding protein
VIAYIDASVLLRIVLDEANPLREWNDLHGGVASTLIRVECLRTFDRLWHRHELNEEALEARRVAANTIIDRLTVVPLDQSILDIAARPLPTPLGTLDGLHLASALAYRETQPDDERPILFATHDVALARAATAMHFDVIGALP